MKTEDVAREIIEQTHYGASISDVMQLIDDFTQSELEKVLKENHNLRNENAFLTHRLTKK